jgi:glucose/arabinose dehydrogenase
MQLKMIFHGGVSIRRVIAGLVLACTVGYSLVQPAGGVPAAALQTNFPTIDLVEVASGLESPVYLTHAGDDSGRAFIVEQAGRIRVWKDGQLQAGVFLDIEGKVRFSGEQGLLGLAFPPNYASKGYFYVYYTNNAGDNQVSRFYTLPGGQSADPNSEELILPLKHPVNSNHNGGQIAFGPNGYLYVATGDGGGGGDPQKNGQNPNTLLGKLLRLDVEPLPIRQPSGANRIYLPVVALGGDSGFITSYRIPSTNPFALSGKGRGEVWALGLRNPWRFSFDRQTGDLYTGDVGQGEWEEINFQPAGSSGGENYGWNVLEGPQCYPSGSNCTPPANYSPPVASYNHTDGCSVTGGYVYRGSTQVPLQGTYFFADFCTGKIWGLQRQGSAWAVQELDDSAYNISSFGEDQSGELYVVDHTGTIYHLKAGQ